MLDATLALKAEFDALVTAPASSFTSYSGWRLTPAVGTGKTAGRFAFFTAPTGTAGVRAAGDTATVVEGVVTVSLFVPVPASPDDDDVFLPYQAAAALFASLTGGTPTRRMSHGNREYQVGTEWSFEQGLDRPPWAASRDCYRLDAAFDVAFIRTTA